MTVDRAGNVYVALSSEIVKFSPRGIPLRSWRPGGSSGGQYDFAGLAVDSRGNVYVTNRTQHALQIFSPSGRMVTSWTHLGPKGPQLTNPGAVALDSRNDIVLIDGTRVLELAPLRLRRSA
jgi:sugar lactone lactonase YvrE